MSQAKPRTRVPFCPAARLCRAPCRAAPADIRRWGKGGAPGTSISATGGATTAGQVGLGHGLVRSEHSTTLPFENMRSSRYSEACQSGESGPKKTQSCACESLWATNQTNCQDVYDGDHRKLCGRRRRHVRSIHTVCTHRFPSHLGFLTSVMPFFRCWAQNSAGCPPPSRPKHGCTEQPPGCRQRAAVTFTAPAGACAAQYLAAPVAPVVVAARAGASDADVAAVDGDGVGVPPSGAATREEACKSAVDRGASALMPLLHPSLRWFLAVATTAAAAAALLEGNRVQPGCKHVLCFVSTMPSSLCSFQ